MTTHQSRSLVEEQIAQEAAEWFVDFRVGDVDGHARAEFDSWLRQSPAHIRAYMEVAKAYGNMPSPRMFNEACAADLIRAARSETAVISLEDKIHTRALQGRSSERNAAYTSPAEAMPSSAAGSERPITHTRRWSPIAKAAAIACLVVGGTVALLAVRDPVYSTSPGERRSVTLDDGSLVDLNARSKVRVSWSRSSRQLELIEGEALFDVAKDPERPFVVRAGTTYVRAIGTQFDVHRKQTDTTVTVIEGRVAVYVQPSAAVASGESPSVGSEALTDRYRIKRETEGFVARGQASSAVLVSAGQQLTITGVLAGNPQVADSIAAAAWVQRRLIFEDSRLGDVLQEFNRHNKRQLVIDDDALNDLRISGVYSSTDPGSLLRFLSAQPGIRVIESSDRVVITRE